MVSVSFPHVGGTGMWGALPGRTSCEQGALGLGGDQVVGLYDGDSLWGGLCHSPVEHWLSHRIVGGTCLWSVLTLVGEGSTHSHTWVGAVPCVEVGRMPWGHGDHGDE